MPSDLLRQIGAAMPPDLADPGDDHMATRAKFAPLHGHPVAPDTLTRPVQVGGVAAIWLERPDSEPHRGSILLCHGGAFVSCDAASYLFYAEMAARATGLPVLVVDYRLAPEHRFPAALNDCAAAYRALVAEGHDPGRLLCLGDSCGGGLALAVGLDARHRGLPLPGALISLSGWIDLTSAGYGPGGPAGPDPFISEGFIRRRVADYLGDADPGDWRASPVRADPAGLPPVLLQVGEVDACRLDAERYAARAAAAGVEVTLDVVAGGVHGVQGLATIGVPEAEAAWAAVGRFVESVLPG